MSRRIIVRVLADSGMGIMEPAVTLATPMKARLVQSQSRVVGRIREDVRATVEPLLRISLETIQWQIGKQRVLPPLSYPTNLSQPTGTRCVWTGWMRGPIFMKSREVVLRMVAVTVQPLLLADRAPLKMGKHIVERYIINCLSERPTRFRFGQRERQIFPLDLISALTAQVLRLMQNSDL